jgi:hypothetical protein
MAKLKRMRWTGPVTNMGEKRNVYKVFAGKLEGKAVIHIQNGIIRYRHFLKERKLVPEMAILCTCALSSSEPTDLH